MLIYEHQIFVEHIIRSSGHNYFTRKRFEPEVHDDELLETIFLEPGRGIANDRFEFSRYPITFFSLEVADFISEQIRQSIDVKKFRRNIIISGINLNELSGETFQIGEVTFRGIGLCHPCLWMNAVIHEDTYQLMKGRGGLRAEVVVGGIMNRGKNRLYAEKKLMLPALEKIVMRKLP